MKQDLEQLLAQALARAPALRGAEVSSAGPALERTRDPRHGDFTTNVAMQLAKPLGLKPRELAEAIVAALPESELVASVEIAGPGFINFRLAREALHREIARVLEQRASYGRGPARERPRILVEFVSANPTGPLHVGHGRHAAYGASLANLFEAAGYPVDREYYVNDAGRQMDILGVSVWLRALERRGESVPFPQAGYRGEYIRDIAAAVDASGWPPLGDDLKSTLPPDAPEGDKEAYIGALLEAAERHLGAERFGAVRRYALESILDDIKDDLAEFGVVYDRWYSEQSLADDGRIGQALAELEKRRMLYKKDGATWFRATDYGDEKDRVVVRENGKTTYFASDIAYHYDKRQRGYDHLLDVLGADHHGYVSRVGAGLEAMGFASDDLEVRLVQFVTLYRGGEKLSMSTRSGEFVTLRQLREEVGNDAARFFYVMRSNDQHLDFDLELAKSRSNENPVYYIQYAYARVASVFRQARERGIAWNRELGVARLGHLREPHEEALMRTVTRYPEIIELAAANRAPHHLVHYLRDLANDFHTYYNAHTFIVDDEATRNARLALIAAAQQVIASGLAILGVSAPEAM
ncbi:MAG TPA: arginine--tRNA ligase [Woeseiaceae bacterium]